MAEPMTWADVLAKIQEHFSQPGAVLGYDDELATCVYRGDNEPSSPVRCAVGCLIPDDRYTPAMEHKSIYGIWDQISDLFDTGDVTETWLAEVQAAHDDAAQDGIRTPEDFLTDLRDLGLS